MLFTIEHILVDLLGFLLGSFWFLSFCEFGLIGTLMGFTRPSNQYGSPHLDSRVLEHKIYTAEISRNKRSNG